MKVGLVCPYSFDVPGGVQYHVRDLALWLGRNGHQASVLAPADDQGPLPDYLTSCGRAVPVRYNGSVARLTFGMVTASRVNRWLEEGDFDVLHIHEPMTPSASVIALWSFDGPIVATFHTATLRSRAMAAAYPLLRPSLEKISGRIAVSEAARQTVIAHIGGDAVVIPNGVDVPAFTATPARPAWQGSTGAPVVGFLGRHEEPRKGFTILAAAMERVLAHFPGARLLVAGPGDSLQAREQLSRQVAAATTFLGPLDEQDKIAFLRSLDVYVAPNTGGESFGIILVEAMAAGAPVLASDLPAFERVLSGPGERAGVTFANTDPQSLAERLTGLLADPERRADLAGRGLRRAMDFDWSRVANDVLAVYDTVAPMRGQLWK